MTNKVTLNALSRKHAQLQTQMITVQNQLKSVQTNLNAVETTIHLIEPTFEIKGIKPASNYAASKFKRGEVPNLVGDFVRESTGNFSCPEIVSSIREKKDFEVSGNELEKLNLRVYNALKRLEKNKIIVYVGQIKSAGAAVLWRRCV